MKSLQRGFTLLELMVTIAIVGILASIAFWDSSDMLEENRAESFLLELKRNVSFARAKATSTDSLVVVCSVIENRIKTNKGESQCKNSWNDDKSIIVFLDGNQDKKYNTGQDTLLRIMERVPDNSKLKFTGKLRLIFDASGRITTDPGTFIYCPNKDNKNNKALTITQSGTALYNGDTTETCD